MGNWWRQQLGQRPWWMNVLMFFCAYLAFLYVPWDLFAKPLAQDAEVWFGIMLRGWAAKLTEPLHWAIYAAGTYGFWRMRPWMWPWAAVYVAQLALASLVWNAAYVGGFGGWFAGIASAAVLSGLGVMLWNARPIFDRRRPNLRQRYGEWAVITGASAGIGAEFARAVARDGMSCMLVARRKDRLEALAAELEANFKAQTRIVATDLSRRESVDEVVAAAEGLDVGLLINNAGAGYAGSFAKQDGERLYSMVQLNCAAPVALTRRFLPHMQERRRGAVIVTGSIAGIQPVPFNGVYSATKAFDRFFGEMLWAELHGTGIDVLVLEPGPTATEFQAVAGETAHPGEHPAKVVDLALEALGRQPSVVSGWLNWLQSIGARLVPRSLLALLAGRVMRQWTPAEMR